MPITKDTTLNLKEEARQARLKKNRERKRKARERARERKYAAPEGKDIVAVGHVPLWKGHDGKPSTIHGFYRKDLDEREQAAAEYLFAAVKKEEGIARTADLMMLELAIQHFVKGVRPEPPQGADDKNVKSTQGYHARLFRDFMDSLGATRKSRQEDENNSAIADALREMFGKKTLDMTKNATGSYAADTDTN